MSVRQSASFSEFLAENRGGAMTEANVRDYLVAKALEDDAFRKSLVADPTGTVAAEIGRTLPDGMKLRVHQESHDELHIVLPVPAELTARDMHSVAGGWDLKVTDDPDDHHELLAHDDPCVDDDDDC